MTSVKKKGNDDDESTDDDSTTIRSGDGDDDDDDDDSDGDDHLPFVTAAGSVPGITFVQHFDISLLFIANFLSREHPSSS